MESTGLQYHDKMCLVFLARSLMQHTYVHFRTWQMHCWLTPRIGVVTESGGLRTWIHLTSYRNMMSGVASLNFEAVLLLLGSFPKALLIGFTKVKHFAIKGMILYMYISLMSQLRGNQWKNLNPVHHLICEWFYLHLDEGANSQYSYIIITVTSI